MVVARAQALKLFLTKCVYAGRRRYIENYRHLHTQVPTSVNHSSQSTGLVSFTKHAVKPGAKSANIIKMPRYDENDVRNVIERPFQKKSCKTHFLPLQGHVPPPSGHFRAVTLFETCLPTRQWNRTVLQNHFDILHSDEVSILLSLHTL